MRGDEGEKREEVGGREGEGGRVVEREGLGGRRAQRETALV